LNPLTDIRNKPLLYQDTDLFVTFTADDNKEVVYQGRAVTLEDRTIKLTVVPPKKLIGDFSMQVCLVDKPILARPLRFQVV